MDNKDELQEFDLDEILSEFHDDAQSAPSQAADEDLEELLGDLPDLDLSDEEAPESEEESPQSPVQEDADPDSQPQTGPAEDTVSYTPQAPAEETTQVPDDDTHTYSTEDTSPEPGAPRVQRGAAGDPHHHF